MILERSTLRSHKIFKTFLRTLGSDVVVSAVLQALNDPFPFADI